MWSESFKSLLTCVNLLLDFLIMDKLLEVADQQASLSKSANSEDFELIPVIYVKKSSMGFYWHFKG